MSNFSSEHAFVQRAKSTITKSRVFVTAILVFCLISTQSAGAQGIIEESSKNIDSATELSYFLSHLVEGLISASLSEEFYDAFFETSAIYCIFSSFSVIAAIVAFAIAILPTFLLLAIWYLPFFIPAILSAFAGFFISPLLLSPIIALLSFVPGVDASVNAMCSPIYALSSTVGIPVKELMEPIAYPQIVGLLFLPPVLALVSALIGFFLPFFVLVSSPLLGSMIGTVIAYYIENSIGLSDDLSKLMMITHSQLAPYLKRIYDSLLVNLFDGLDGAIDMLSMPIKRMINSLSEG